jgi:hypothetical protein
MVVVIKPVTLENLDEEMEPCLEDIPAEKEQSFPLIVNQRRNGLKSSHVNTESAGLSLT